MKIRYTQVLERTDDASELLVCGTNDDGKEFAVVTTISEGGGEPDCFDVLELWGSLRTHEPGDETDPVFLHEALDEQTTVVAEEISRICGE